MELKIEDLADIARLVENQPQLWDKLDDELQQIIQKPSKMER